MCGKKAKIGVQLFLVILILFCGIGFLSDQARGQNTDLDTNAIQASGTGTRWSDPKTWEGEKLPKAGDTVVLPENRKVLLDVTPPRLKGLLINGQLRFDDKDLELKVSWILVRGKNSLLEIGTQKRPFQKKAVLTFFGIVEEESLVGTGLMSMGTKFLGTMHGGQLELHGARGHSLSWTQLNAHAKPGDTKIILQDEVDWQPGDQIVIAPSGFDPREAESVRVTQVKGNVVHFEPALKHRHWGTLQKYAGRVLDERAEVGLLTRNILLQGSDESLQSNFGGHVMIMPNSSAHVEGVEFYRMGQMGHQGRYPMHWHLVDRRGDGSHPGKGQYAKNNSFHRSFQRAVVVHGTNNVLVEGNVAYDIFNHAYVVAEDGDEEDNIFRNNLGMLIRKPSVKDIAFPSGHNHIFPSSQNETRASVFWMKNPNNTLVGNHACGTDNGHGYFIDGDFFNGKHSGGLKRPKIKKHKCVFRDNVAHSNFQYRASNKFHPGSYDGSESFGLFVGRVTGNRSVGGKRPYYDPKDSGEGLLAFGNFTAYKNGGGGAWLERPLEVLKDSILADNTTGVNAEEPVITNVIFVGKSENDIGGYQKAYRKDIHISYGIFIEDQCGGGFHAKDNIFINLTHAIRLNDDINFGKGCKVGGCQFNNVQVPFQLSNVYEEDVHGVLLDSDGSLTGTGRPTWLSYQRINGKSKRNAEWNAYLTPAEGEAEKR